MMDRVERAMAEVSPVHLAHPTLAAIKAYWDAKRGDRPMPSRADISPSDLKEHLGWICMLDALPDYADFRYRLVGTKVTRYFRVESTGKTISEAFSLFGEGAVKGVLAIHRKVARDRVPLRAHGDAGWLGAAHQNFDALYLPLSNDGVSCNMILNAFTFDYARVVAKSDSALP